MTSISLNADCLHQLDLSPVTTVIQDLLPAGATADPQLCFDIDYPRELTDPRELSEIPEVRLWFVRLDARYPWLPLWLNWRQELSRYTAMLVPHQFLRSEGIQYNPEALELFVMHKIFVCRDWLQSQGIDGRSQIKAMALTLGYELDDSLFDVLTL